MRQFVADGIPVGASSVVPKLSRQPYFCLRNAPISEAQIARGYPANTLIDGYGGEPVFGCRCLAGGVAVSADVMSRRTSWKFYRNNQWWPAFCGRRGKIGSFPGH